MSTLASFATQLRSAICQEVEIAEDSAGRYLVHVPFMFADGDHYVIIAEHDGAGWAFTDEGHTLMHLSYTLPRLTKKPSEIIDRVLQTHRVENEQGVLRRPFKPELAADALFEFALAITQVMDTSFLATRERVSSPTNSLVKRSAGRSFKDEFLSVVVSAGRPWRVDPDYVHLKHDAARLYPVDARVNGARHAQALLFAIGNDLECQRATIIRNRWKDWGEQFQSVGIFSDPNDLSSDVIARFADVGEERPPYTYDLEEARRRLPEVLEEILSA